MTLARRFVPLAALVLVARATAAGEPAAAPPASLTVEVKTELVAYPKPGDPPPPKDAEPRASQQALVAELEAGPAAGVVCPTDAGAPWHGVLDVGGKKTTVVVLRGAGADDALTLLLDADRDGKIDDAKERYAPTAQPLSATTLRLGTDWRVEAARLGDASVRVLVSERLDAMTGAMMIPNAAGKPPENRPLAFLATKPTEMGKAPDLPGRLSYATAKRGDTTVYVVAARGEGDALALLVDDKADFSTAQKVGTRANPMKRGTRVVGTQWRSDAATIAGKTVTFTVVETVHNLSASFNAQGSRRGSADVEGRPHVLFLLDGDLDGRFDGAEDRWWFGAKGALENPNAYNMFEGDSPGLLPGGLVWGVKSVAADGTVTVVRSADADAADRSLRTRADRVNAKKWFPLFDADKDFATSKKLDLSRPRAKEPAPFHFAMSLEDARALAAKTGKPLLVDFEADWCVWCKRLDYHTYVDQEVCERLGRFAAVKINTEIDPSKTTRALKWNGIPAVGIFRPDGLPLVFQMPAGDDGKPGPVVDHIPGWLKPEMFVKTLDAALAAYDDMKAGKPPLELSAPKPRGPAATPTPAAPQPPATPPSPVEPKSPEAPTAPAAPPAPGAPPAMDAPAPPT